jgi:K+/H+ antiporter YhaU regulatory subunit KhtT
MADRIELPRYIKIAVDVASRIYKGSLKEGSTLKGRSILASEYNVSPETIRRSMKLLEDKAVVEVNKGIGAIVKSPKNALQFIDSFKEKEHIGDLRNGMKKLIDKRDEVEREIQEVNSKILEYSYRYKGTNLVEILEVEVPVESKIIGKTVGEVQFWYNTAATIVGVKREDTILISPGPYLVFTQGDIILAVGDEWVSERIRKFLENYDN